MNRRFAPLVVVFLLLPLPDAPRASEQPDPAAHPALPGTADELWLVPADDARSERMKGLYRPLAEAVDFFGAGDHARALAMLDSRALNESGLANYVTYYRGMAQLKLSRAADARATLRLLRERKPQGYLAVAAALGEAEAAAAAGDFSAAKDIYAGMARDESKVTPDIVARLGRAAMAAGDRDTAARAWLRVHHEFPLSDVAVEAKSALGSLKSVVESRGAEAALGRALVLYGARRYTDARAAFLEIRDQVNGEDREIVELRIAECDYFLERYRAAQDGLRPWLNRGSRTAEARFFNLSALRELGRHAEYVAETRALVDDFPDNTWAEEALNNLGTHFILTNEDSSAAEVFRELYARFPSGDRAERAAWKYGWWSYKNADYAETVRVFESAAATFPRSNYRPSFLYWASRAHGKLGAGSEAASRMRLVFADYGNSYYGRLAERQLPRNARTVTASDAIPAARRPVDPPDLREPPTASLIRALIAAQLYDDALNELRFAQRAWGTSPRIDATLAWVYNRKGELRRAITLMRRAYPQHLTSDGQELPNEILQIIFPLTYWDEIRKYSAARDLDPYLVAALIAQESTFDPKIRSTANAWGLMQVIPATGRRLARSLGVRRFRTSMLTDPNINLRMGTLYFSRLVQQFGGAHYALASYNAGENRVVRWKAERPGLDQDEFIDDIPFPETQNYVKRILGTAEDYRRLYGKGGGGRPIPVQ